MYEVTLMVVGGSAVALALALWGSYTNEKTYRHRRMLIDLVYAPSRVFLRYNGALDTVTYEAHFWALFLLRDPWVLYPQELADAMRAVDKSTRR